MFLSRPPRIVRFLFSGAVGLSVNLSVLHVAVAYVGAHYLLGSVIAVLCSIVVGFLLQKFWTFEERTADAAHSQFALYAALAIMNIGLNTLIVYILAGKMGLHYLIAQTIAAGTIALWSFFVYREVIFKTRGSSAS